MTQQIEDAFEDTACCDMPLVQPEFKTGAIDRAGRIIAGLQEPDDVADFIASQIVFENWRTCHSYPLSIFRNGLNAISASGFKNRWRGPIVAQRLKRRATVIQKLKRFPTLRLSQLQDMAGCRVILPDLPTVYEFQEALLARKVGHTFRPGKDYIKNPKPDGYRGVHIICEYKGKTTTAWNGLRIEIQLRTSLQHAWATAVESVDVLKGSSLKSGGGGDDWKRFFALMSSLIAGIENEARVPGTPEDLSVLRREMSTLSQQIGVETTMRAYETAHQFTQMEGWHEPYYYVMTIQGPRTDIRPFLKQDLLEATNYYAELEALGQNVVMVTVSDIASLKKAYPNYFADTQDFVTLLRHESALVETPHGLMVDTTEMFN